MRLTRISCFVALSACSKDGEPAGTTEPTLPRAFDDFAPVDLTNIEVVRDLSTLSALGMLQRYEILTSEPLSTGDPGCPLVEDDGAGHVVVTGDCTDTRGVVWTGTLDSLAAESSVLDTFTGFGFTATGDCYGARITLEVAVDGTVAIDDDSGAWSFDLHGVWPHLNIPTCEVTDAGFILDYDVSIGTVGYSRLYSGAGRYADDVHGLVELQTIDQLPGACTEPLSGVTLLSTPDHQVAISYDGAFDCDDPGTATWSLDGQAQGELLGVECASTPGAVGWLALAALATLIHRRR